MVEKSGPGFVAELVNHLGQPPPPCDISNSSEFFLLCIKLFMARHDSYCPVSAEDQFLMGLEAGLQGKFWR